ncbi:uncharacterized protein [Pocillopora verrucosa]|uniref:uncharacterized protein n=1 Tax=Pocillopora verrucosa TaxID=203993 RepID=UPI003341421C
MMDSGKLEVMRRSVGPWISQFEGNDHDTNSTYERSEATSPSNYTRNAQGVFVQKKPQLLKKKKVNNSSLDRKFRYDVKKDEKIQGDPFKSIFVARLDYNTTEEKLFEIFGRYGSIKMLRLVKDVKTGESKGYTFVEFSDESEAKRALRETKDKPLVIDGRKILVDRVRAGVIESWLPRRLGGGLGQRQKGTQRFAWKLAYFGDPSRIDHDGIYRRQQLWMEHNRRSMKLS